MPVLNQPSRTSLHRPLLLLVLAGALGACDEESPPPRLLVIEREAHDFGQVHAGELSAERVFTVRNAGPEQLAGLGVRLEPADSFRIRGTTCVGWLAPSEHCTVAVAFRPAHAGPIQADLVVEAEGADASAALSGVGAVTVRVTKSTFEEITVESAPAGIRCGDVCEATFTVPEIVLTVVENGQPQWTGECRPTIDGDCLLSLQGGDVSVSVDDFITGLQWSVLHDGQTHALAIDPANDIIRASSGTPFLSRRSPDGELLWQLDAYGAGTAAVDADGNIGFASSAGVVRKLRPDGGTTWSVDLAEDTLDDVVQIAFDRGGNLYVAGQKGGAGAQAVHLLKYDRDGGLMWSQTYAPLAETGVADMAVDESDNVILTGSAAAESPEPTGFHYVRKYDRDGNVVWTDEVVGILAARLAVDTAGNIFVADRVAFAGTIIKYNPDGVRLWTVVDDELGGWIADLATTPDGDVIAIGRGSDLEGAPVGVWAAKFSSQDGARLRPIREFGVTGYSDAVIAVDADGDVILAAGEDDAWLYKYDGAQFDRPDE